MRLFIPACGDRITLAKPWEFDLYLEYRNARFAEEAGLVRPKKRGDLDLGSYRPDGSLKKVRATLPKGTVLECDRVYIRTFSKSALEVGSDFDSLTWRVMRGDKAARNQRFWAKLTDCLSIEYSPAGVSQYRDRVKLLKLVHQS